MSPAAPHEFVGALQPGAADARRDELQQLESSEPMKPTEILFEASVAAPRKGHHREARLDTAPAAGAPVRLVAVVAVHDGGEDIGRCLVALLAAGQAREDIVVVDDASRDGAAAAAAERHGVHLVRLEGRPGGAGRARNHGARLAQGADALLFVDADVLVHADVPERFRALLAAEPTIGAAFGSYDDDPAAQDPVSRYKNLLHHWMHQHGAAEASTFWTGCGVVRRELFFRLGGFDESSPLEDIELGLRLHDAGHRLRLCPDIQCRHLKRWTLASWLRTDIFVRALPWSRMLEERGQGIPDDLNLGRRERVSAAFALGVVASLLAVPFAPAIATAALSITLALFIGLQRRLLGFFARRGGCVFAAGATLMHLTYFVCASASFVYVRLIERPPRMPCTSSSAFMAGSNSRKSKGTL